MSTVTDQNTREQEHAATVNTINTKIAAEFAKYGKTFTRSESFHQQYVWEDSLRLYVGIETYRGSWAGSYNGNTELVLGAQYYGTTVAKDGSLITFSKRQRRISLGKPIEEIFEVIEECIATLPAKMEGIKKAQAIEQEREARREIAHNLQRERVRQIAAITGYKTYNDFSGFTGLYETPYENLEVRPNGKVLVAFAIPLSEFEAFHKQFCAGNVAKSE